MGSRKVYRAERVTRGTRNVFADLGYLDATERQAKLRLAYALNQVLAKRKLSKAEAANVLGLTQPASQHSAISNSRASRSKD